ncbi:hypothetical protein SAY87_023090 [Trapa incisa]|uniref:Sister chromatid cohesion 1 protein 3 n=1 Tax=Trapa incisa TaxID=236973 RepID=A0AAN7K7L0_9MYRT|nr:hypothetical protein SAY87_023090 [Trapa incisa]
MFYSQTFLGRKGPLGMVWRAAHYQHCLKKSHYASTDIPKTIDYIMFPEVPIALRLSGHLLLGVVRIYSKKVEYLIKDCNIILTGLSRLIPMADLTLPEDARQAPVHSIVIPETFQLDALTLDESFYNEDEDIHRCSREAITLTDDNISIAEPFTTMNFGDTFGIPLSPDRQNSPIPSMEGQGIQINGEENDPPPRDPGLDCQTEVQNGTYQEEVLIGAIQEENSMHSIPEIEIMREAETEQMTRSPFDVPICLDDTRENRETAPVMNDMVLPEMNEARTPQGASPVNQQQHSGQMSSPSTLEAPEILGADNSFGPNLVIRSSPPPEIRPSPQANQPPLPRRRKRKQFFDESVVLTNRFMRRALNDTNDILRKRKPTSSRLDMWKVNIRQRRDQIFDHPSITGMCEDLLAVSNKDYMSSKARSISFAEVPPNPMEMDDNTALLEEESFAEVPPDPMEMDDNTAPLAGESFPDQTDFISTSVDHGFDLEIERLRQHEESGNGSGAFHELLLSPPRVGLSSTRRSEYTPFTDNDASLYEIPQSTTMGSSNQTLTDLAMSTGPFTSDLETPIMFSGEELGVQENRLSDIQEFGTSDDLNFLEADSPSPSSSCRGQGQDSLSVRTRAVAQYLQRQSPIAEGQSEYLNLNKLLEGKTRRLCARMFYETLVLKSYGLVDGLQEEAYGDIHLKLTPTMSKTQL